MENYKLKKLKQLKPYLKTNKEIVKFDDTEIDTERPILINDIDIN